MSEKNQKPYTAQIVDAEGQELCSKGFDFPQRAKGKVCRVMADNPGSTGKVVYNNVILPSTGLPMEELVSREFAMHSLLGSKGGPVMQSKKGSNSANNMKASQTRCSFSHG